MRNRFYLLMAMLIAYSFSMAQLTEVYPPEGAEKPSVKKVRSEKYKQNKSTPCSIDTLYYSKYNNSFTAPRYLRLDPGWGAGTYFHVDDTVWLYGFNFYGYALTQTGGLTNQNVDCKVYYASQSGLPAGVALQSKTETVQYTGFNVNQLKETVVFTNPVMLVADFVITIEIPSASANDVVTLSNDYLNFDGKGNHWSCVKLASGWSNNLNIGTDPFDADFYLEPIVEYNMTADYEPGENSCLGNGKVFDFVNTSTFALNPQFSPDANDTLLEDNFIWDYGDGSATDTALNGSNFYSGTLGYYVDLEGEFRNWIGSTCKADTLKFLEEGEVQANFSSNANGLIVSFTNKSIKASSYLWDFGDGTTTSPLKNPTHTYGAPGIYYVSLRARDKGCVDSVSVPVILEDYTGIVDQRDNFTAEISPNPANDFVYIKSNLDEGQEGKWKIYSIHGKLIKEGVLRNEMAIQVDDLLDGVYFVRFSLNDEVLSKRLIIR